MTCARCGADLPERALFCGECGSAVYAATPAAGPADVAATPATTDSVVAPPASAPAAGAAPGAAPAGEGDENATRIVDLLEQQGAWRPPTGDSAPPVVVESASPALAEPSGPPIDEATRMPERAKPEPVAFTLHFSTGESVTVEGTGLVGRRPAPQPGEFFDGYVTIDDPGRSVSKTHLEFGQEGGVFWISDRFSANGTVVREPGRAPRLCPAGMRSRVPRGSRVDIGEQFFVVT
ncbi:hypothetical protein [Herbiconiux sp. L3-i23]|uniref:hypothetical protein n=1 Tax=Herbiconiux sp. L3-i23 TaxID=2905871 RepID=UPI0020664732|nr:hypothetical protein [Herbiconiux sp. L3-i23]BDI22032.1 hypothetical protein L3i23_08080 [Herbiconiux sp. L3-i23]